VTDAARRRLPVDGPAVVALGGGHGLSVALTAARRYARSVTAVVSVAAVEAVLERVAPHALAALERADQVILGPGSLYTSLLPVLCVQELREAVLATPATVVQVANLRPQVPETTGLDGTDHLRAVLEHGARVDTFLYDEDAMLEADEAQIRSWGVEPRAATVARTDGAAHDSAKLATALQVLL